MMMVDAESSGGSLAGVRIQGRDTFRNGRSGWSSRLDLQVQVYNFCYVTDHFTI